MAVKIYTKTGDKGETSLFGGKRVSKADLRVEAYGTVDELNSAIGVTIAGISNIKKELIAIQQDLFSIGSRLASPGAVSKDDDRALIKRVSHFEKLIDEMTGELPQLHNFILPGGTILASALHLARSICRRLERRVVELSQTEPVDSEILRYFNRLSDLLFTMARFANYQAQQTEIIWPKKQKED